MAKIASDLRKPDGLVVVPPGDEAAFLAPLPISRLWGVGERTAASLAEYGVRTIGDLAGLARRRSWSAGSGSTAHRSSTGRAASTPTRSTTATRRSRSATSTRSTSTRATARSIERTLLAMADGVAARLRSSGTRAGTVAVKIRDSAFHTITRQRTLAEPTDLTEPICRDGARARAARGPRASASGCSASTASNLGDREQLGLFSDDDPRRRRAVEAADAVRRRYGEDAVTRARLLGAGLPAPFERDPRNPLDRRAGGHADRPGRRGRRRRPERRDRQAVTARDDIPPDDA